MFDIITIGSSTRDVFMFTEALHPHHTMDSTTHIEACLPFGAKINVNEIHYDTGGGATNTAVTFARLGKFRVASLTSIGRDDRGKLVTAVLRKNNVRTDLIQLHDKEHTAYSVILSPAKENGERTILTYRGASAHLSARKIPWNKLNARWFYITSLGGDLTLIEKIITHAKRLGASIAFNPGGQEIYRRKKCIALCAEVDVLILNREEACQLVRQPFKDTSALLRALASVSPTVVMTDGPKGAYAVYKDTSYYTPSAGHKAKNQTGAGDAFGSGFLTAWIKSHGDIKEALQVGSFNADSVVQHIGAKAGILHEYPSKKYLHSLPIKKIRI